MSKPDNNTAQLRQALEQLASETESVGHSHCEQEYCDGWFGEDPYRDTIDQLLALFQEHSTARVPQKRDLNERISTDEKYDRAFMNGWNSCIRELESNTKESSLTKEAES